MRGPRWVLVGAAVLAACGDGGGGGDGAATGSLAELLALVPAEAGYREQPLLYGSLARIREAGGIEPAGDPGDELRALADVTLSLYVAEPFTSRPAEIEPDELGVTLPDIDASLTAGSPPDALSVLTGRIDAGDVDGAMTTFEPFAADLEREERGDVTVYRFGGENRPDPGAITPARPLGVGGRWAVRDGTLWRTGTDASLDVLAAVAAGDAEPIADVDGVGEVAGVLDAAGVRIAAVLADPNLGRFDPVTVAERLTPEVADALAEELAGLTLQRWDVAGLGEAFVDGDPDANRMTIALWHADEATAAANEEALGQMLAEGSSLVSNEPWSQVCAGAEIRRDGAMVTATCTPASPGLAVNVVFARDVLIAWQ